LNTLKIRRGFQEIALLAAIIVFAFLRPAYADSDAKVLKILIVSPVIQASQEMGFLRAGVVDMLASRLSHAGKLETIRVDPSQENLPSDDAAAVALARQSGADYVLLESLTMLGNNVSTDARMLETVQGKVVLNFGRAGMAQGDVIAHIDELAAQINTQLLGRPQTTIADQAKVPVLPPKTGSVDQADIHQHPEKLLPPINQGQRLFAGNGSRGSAASSANLLLRTPRLDRQVRGVTAGDVDGDGKAEIICIDSTAIVVFHQVQGKLAKLNELDAGAGNVGVDAADLNHNGLDEIFVTNFDDVDGRVYSYVLEWDGSQFKRIAERLSWYFRSVDLAERGRVLVGQRQGIDERFSPGIFEMGFSNGTYEGIQKLNLPRSLNVYAFAEGDLRTAGQPDIADYSPSGYLRVLDHRGREEWSSIDSYGGTVNALNTKSKDDPREKDYFFLPSRVHLLDLDGDGVQEIVTVRNEDSAGALSHTKLFKSGQVEILKWDQLGLVPIWRSGAISKFIADFTLTDMDGDGRPELVAVVVQKTKNIVGQGSSYLAIFKLATSALNNEQ
jgi:TolB-like protein